MQLFIAKNSGFCFGVQNAVEKARDAAKNGGEVYTYGPIIHNKTVVDELRKNGVGVIDNIECNLNNSKVIIRSHGIAKQEYERLLETGADIVDATCPYVKNIHRIVEEKSKLGYKVVIIGNPEHPEVIGVSGWCNSECIIIKNEDDIKLKLTQVYDKMCIVSQTTFNMEKWYSLIPMLLRYSREITIYNTICSSTRMRQEEALELSQMVDLMIVVGGRESSNSMKLYEICKENCNKAIFIENPEELNIEELNDYEKIGLTAGASTPNSIINRVIEKINGDGVSVNKNIINKKEEVKMEEVKETISETMEDFISYFTRVSEGSIVRGKVLLVNEKEVFFDIGYKADAIMPLEEASNVVVDLKEKYKLGDEVDVEVIKMNDGEGNVVVSKRSLEKEEFYNMLRSYSEEGKQIEVSIEAVNKGGFTCQYLNIRAFMPFSLSGVSRNEDQNAYVGKKVKVVISDVKEKRFGVELVVSRKEIVKQEKEDAAAVFFEKLDCGQVYKGEVKGIINQGIFVNVGAVDVFVPISELSWKRISKPQDIINENQRVEVLIIKVNKEEKKVTGSIKQLGQNPWEKFISEYKDEDVIEGKVTGFADFGAFVEVIDGVEGLVHISQISEKRINKPQDILKLGQKVNVKIIKIDLEGKKVSLSIKEVQ